MKQNIVGGDFPGNFSLTLKSKCVGSRKELKFASFFCSEIFNEMMFKRYEMV